MLRAAILAAFLALAAGPVLAANANQPNTNVDKRNDKGGDTGDSKVEQLNGAQSDSAQGFKDPALGRSNQTTTQPRQ